MKSDNEPNKPLESIAGSLAILFLERSLREGKEVCIPSLGITIKLADETEKPTENKP